MRSYALVGELLFADGTTYTRLARYEAPDMEVALRRAAAIVARWRGERIAAYSHATVRDIIEMQISEDHTVSSRSDSSQDQQEGEQREEEPPRFPHEQGGALLVGMIARGEKVVRSSVHAHSLPP